MSSGFISWEELNLNKTFTKRYFNEFDEVSLSPIFASLTSKLC